MLNQKLAENDVPFGVLAGQAKEVELVTSGRHGEIWQGIGHFKGNGEIPIYFRIMKNRELFTECLSLLISRYLNVPSPKIALVAVHPTHFPIHVTLSTTVAMAVLRDEHPSLLRHITQIDDSPPIYDLISKWSHLATAAALDEWLGVNTRPAGSFLVDGGRELLLHSFPGAIAEGFEPDGYIINSLMLMLELNDRSELGLKRTKKLLNKAASKFHEAPLYDLIDQMKLEILDGEDHIDSAINLLDSRINELSGLFDSAIRTSQVSMDL